MTPSSLIDWGSLRDVIIALGLIWALAGHVALLVPLGLFVVCGKSVEKVRPEHWICLVTPSCVRPVIQLCVRYRITRAQEVPNASQSLRPLVVPGRTFRLCTACSYIYRYGYAGDHMKKLRALISRSRYPHPLLSGFWWAFVRLTSLSIWLPWAFSALYLPTAV